MNVLVIGDIVGKPGRQAISHALPELIAQHLIDLCIANGENAAGGFGITPEITQQFLEMNIHVLTTGNHIWDRKEIEGFINREPRLLRPANYPEGVPGNGTVIVETPVGHSVGIINLSGRVFMQNLDCPFRVAQKIINEFKAKQVKVIIVDMHAEATSEKIALGWYLDGQVSAVLGTHTHVQTADEKILPNGTAYITDIGMTGAHDSVIGLKKDIVLKRFMLQMPFHYDVAKKDIQLNGVIVQIDETTGRATNIRRLNYNLGS
ncbi:MAG: TIGR00282 family metallophosphoesterase [Candidatus Schekmanbacteria bacterium]|nr:TIGR00282 family metallophosphoesterase [Candidatus Schekmanbacteria bacterium]